MDELIIDINNQFNTINDFVEIINKNEFNQIEESETSIFESKCNRSWFKGFKNKKKNSKQLLLFIL